MTIESNYNNSVRRMYDTYAYHKREKQMKSFRIICAQDKTKNCNYLGKTGQTFRNVHLEYYRVISKIRKEAKKIGIEYIWSFYEPYIEITWLGTRKQANELWKRSGIILKKEGINDALYLIGGKDYGGPDWFCKNEGETLFGAKRHAACAALVQAFDEHEEDINIGYGVEAQVQRTIHTICNPLGINYIDESKICFRQGFITYLWSLNFRYPKLFTPKVIMFIYNKILRLGGR